MRVTSLVPGGSRQGRACHSFRGGRDVEHVRQTLSDVRAHIGDVEWGFSDRVSGAVSTRVSVCSRAANLPMVGGYHNCGMGGAENNSYRPRPVGTSFSKSCVEIRLLKLLKKRWYIWLLHMG